MIKYKVPPNSACKASVATSGNVSAAVKNPSSPVLNLYTFLSEYMQYNPPSNSCIISNDPSTGPSTFIVNGGNTKCLLYRRLHVLHHALSTSFAPSIDSIPMPPLKSDQEITLSRDCDALVVSPIVTLAG